jgi:predicted ester cyclase
VSNDNVDVVRRLEAAYASGNLDVLDDILSPDLRSHTPGSDMIPPGIEGIKAANEMSRQAFPDKEIEIQDIFGEGDLVVVRERMTGTNEGGLPWFGIPANGKRVDYEWIQILRLQDGKVVESWANIGLPKMMMQLGAMPGPGEES